MLVLVAVDEEAAGPGVATFLVTIRVVTVVPLPTGFEDFDFEKKLKSAPGADMAERDAETREGAEGSSQGL